MQNAPDDRGVFLFTNAEARTEPRTGGGKALPHFRTVQRGGLAVPPDAHRRRHARRLTDRADRRHHARAAVQFVVERDRPAPHQQVPALQGHDHAVAELVPFAGRHAVDQRAGAGGVVHVDDVRDLGDRVRIFGAAEKILRGLVHDPADAAALPHAHMVRDRAEIRLLEARHVLPQERDELPDLPPPLDLRRGKIGAVYRAPADDPRGVEVDRVGLHEREPEHVFAQTVDAPFLLRLVEEGVDGVAVRHPGSIHAGKLEAGRHRLAKPLRVAEFDRTARQRGQVAVAGGVDEDFAPHRAQPGLGEEHRRRDPPVFHDDVRQRMVVQEPRPGVEQQVLHGEHRLVLGDRTGGAFLVKREPLPAFRRTVLLHLAAPVDVDGPVERAVVDVAQHEGRNFAEHRHAAGAAVALDDQRVRALPRRHDPGADAPRTGPDHDDVGLGDYRDLTVETVTDGFHDLKSFPVMVLCPAKI